MIDNPKMQERRSKGKNDRHRLASSQIEAEDVQKVSHSFYAIHVLLLRAILT